MPMLRVFTVFAWIGISAMTAWAVGTQGLSAGIVTFLADFAHPWRAQFYADLEVHLLLFGGWILFREASRSKGLLFAMLTLLLGALFTLPYLLAASLAAKGDARLLLLGRHRL